MTEWHTKTPVVFIIFNRPENTQKVFNEIAKAKPPKLLVIADGPRKENPEDKENCKAARRIIEQVDWDCEVLTNFSTENMGGPWRISSGLDWVFSNVEEAIILEDDCLPAQSFFFFCENLLEYYRNDERIMHISGDNFLPEIEIPNYSYFFSKYTFTWGWATWKRAWKYFDLYIKTWPEFRDSKILKFISDSNDEMRFNINKFDKVFNCESVHWDTAWKYTVWTKGGLSIIPARNLISNIGFGNESTHCVYENDPRANMPTFDIWNIKHPPFFIRNKEWDLYFHNKFNNQNVFRKIYRAIKEKRLIATSRRRFLN